MVKKTFSLRIVVRCNLCIVMRNGKMFKNTGRTVDIFT